MIKFLEQYKKKEVITNRFSNNLYFKFKIFLNYSAEIAPTGQTAAQAPQSMQASGSITY